LMRVYWEKFHWRLDLNQEPVDGDVFPPDTTLSAADLAIKTKRIEDVKQVRSSINKTLLRTRD
jgi:hypothetical protein